MTTQTQPAPRALSVVEREEIADIKPALHPGVHMESCGLILPASLPYDEWRSILQRMVGLGDIGKWTVGDALNFGERKYGQMYHQAVAETGLAYETLRDRKYVSERFPLSRRRDNSVRWWVFRELAALLATEQDEWLDWCEAQRPTRDLLRQKLRGDRLESPLNLGDDGVPVNHLEVPQGITAEDGAKILSQLSALPKQMKSVVMGALKTVSEEGGVANFGSVAAQVLTNPPAEGQQAEKGTTPASQPELWREDGGVPRPIVDVGGVKVQPFVDGVFRVACLMGRDPETVAREVSELMRRLTIWQETGGRGNAEGEGKDPRGWTYPAPQNASLQDMKGNF